MGLPAAERPVRLKYLDACASGGWHLEIWKRSDEAKHLFIPFTCRSWRCKGRCQLWKGAQDFVRVAEGMAKRSDWIFLTLTYDRRCWRSQWSMYRGGIHLWDHFRKRFIREWGKMDYVQTWEKHADGSPHVHVAIGNYSFWRACLHDWRAVRREWVNPHAISSGFGPRVHLVPCYDRDGLAGYLNKKARELTGCATKNQTPYNAPPHFRRLRASQGLLPPPYKDPDITGVLHRCPVHASHSI